MSVYMLLTAGGSGGLSLQLTVFRFGNPDRHQRAASLASIASLHSRTIRIKHGAYLAGEVIA